MLHLELGQGLELRLHPGLEVVLPVEPLVGMEISPSKKREIRDKDFFGTQDATHQQAGPQTSDHPSYDTALYSELTEIGLSAIICSTNFVSGSIICTLTVFD